MMEFNDYMDKDVSIEVKKFNKKEQPVTTSLAVAETFVKLHRDVLKAIKNLGCSEGFNERNFALVDYVDSKGEKRPMYLMTRDGFTLLAMGYTGEKAMRFKEAYINAFNRMEAELTAKRLSRERGKAARRSLTDTIQEIYGCANLKPNPYAKYTEMVYMAVFGCRASKLKKLKGLDEKDNLRDFLSKEELAAVDNAEGTARMLLRLGWSDDNIEQFLHDNFDSAKLRGQMLSITEEKKHER